MQWTSFAFGSKINVEPVAELILLVLKQVILLSWYCNCKGNVVGFNVKASEISVYGTVRNSQVKRAVILLFLWESWETMKGTIKCGRSLWATHQNANVFNENVIVADGIINSTLHVINEVFARKRAAIIKDISLQQKK